MIHCRLGFVVVALSLCLFAQTRAVSVDEKWTFVWAEPERSGYEVWRGVATVTLQGGILSAKMRSDKGVELVLTGRVSDAKVSAKLTIVGSEFGEVPFSGTYVERQWPDAQLLLDAPVRTYSIVLTDGLNVLALKREVFAPTENTPRPAGP